LISASLLEVFAASGGELLFAAQKSRPLVRLCFNGVIPFTRKMTA